MKKSNEYDALIIGAGMSGLAAAVRLSLFDLRVGLLESHSVAGGLNSHYRRGGYEFDVGLHAMTNWPEGAGRHAPLAKLLRQLRIAADEFALCPQQGSEIRFPGKRLRFNNDFSLLEAEIAREFPRQIDGFRRLTAEILAFPDTSLGHNFVSGREIMTRHLSHPQLIEMLLCPLQFYGCADEHDMDFAQLAIMFKSVFREGFCRPRAGVRQILAVLLDRCQRQNVDLRFRSRVERILLQDGRAVGVRLAGGEELRAPLILSSAGAGETWDLVGENPASPPPRPGRLSFVEVIAIFARDPKEAGFEPTIVFCNDRESFSYSCPDRLVDTRSAVVCCPNHFAYDEALPGGMLRVTHMADYGRWQALSRDGYRAAKADLLEHSLDFLQQLAPGCREQLMASDVFTPLTVERFTGHRRGAVYGSPDKFRSGATPWPGLKLIGTDQGFLGIVGAMLSGISMANLHGLMK